MVFNLKQMAQALILAQENNLDSVESLRTKASEASDAYHEIQTAIKSKTVRMEEIAALQKHIGAYSKTRDVYAAYQKSGYAKTFYHENEEALIRHKEAKAFFDRLGLGKLPSIDSLRQEYATLLAEKKKLYQHYRPARENMMEWRTAQYNIERALDLPASPPESTASAAKEK